MQYWLEWKARIKQVLSRTGYAVFQARGRTPQDGLLTIHSDHFRNDRAFQEAYARGVKAGNGVDPVPPNRPPFVAGLDRP